MDENKSDHNRISQNHFYFSRKRSNLTEKWSKLETEEKLFTVNKMFGLNCVVSFFGQLVPAKNNLFSIPEICQISNFKHFFSIHVK